MSRSMRRATATSLQSALAWSRQKSPKSLSLHVDAFIPEGCHKFLVVMLTSAVVAKTVGIRRFGPYEALPTVASAAAADSNHLQMDLSPFFLSLIKVCLLPRPTSRTNVQRTVK
ncbi:unnamed protein product [Camellia sinensis]